MTLFSIEPRTRKYGKGYWFLSFGKSLSKKYGKQLLDVARKPRIDASKTATIKVNHKAAEVVEEIIGNKTVNEIVKPKPVPDENSARAKSRNIEWIKKIIRKKKHYKIYKSLNDLTVSKLVTENGLK